MKDKEWETTTSSQLKEEGFTITTTDDVDLTPHWDINKDVSWVGSVFTVPKTIGKYTINRELHFHFAHKPNWFHRTMTRLLLGWEWKDE
jgi:hypothetical protein